MSNELVKHDGVQAPSIFTPDQVDLIKSGFCKDLTDDEFKVFLYTCQRCGLDPFARQIFAIKRGGKMTIQTSIDGYRLIADRTGTYAPGPESTFVHDAKGVLVSATAYVKKLTKDGTWHTIATTAYFCEYVQSYNGKPSGLWEKMPRTMLAKCAEALAIRKSWPAELSGLYTKEEMSQADSVEIEIHAPKLAEYITPEQVAELTQIISECDPSKLDAIDEFIRKKCNGGDLTQLKSECYPKLRDLFLDRRNQYQLAKMKEQAQNEGLENGE